MLRILVFLLILVCSAFGVAWIIDRPGEIVLTWQGYRAETSVGIGFAILFLSAAVLALFWGILRFAFHMPRLISRRAAARRLAKGHAAVARGMIAVGAGDARLARKSATEAGQHLSDEPLVLFLAAQAAQLSGDRAAAASAFEKLAQTPETRLLGLRGLHVEAQRRGDTNAALYYAHEAHKVAPLPWSAKAVLDHRAAHGQWEGALAALESHIAAKLVDKAAGARQRAVLETAIALDKADQTPDEALRLARQAHAHAPDLVPATALAARLMSRKGEIRKAAKLIEAAWRQQTHPELAEAYLDLRPGDSNADRLAKAQTLARLVPNDPESHMIVARAALVARDSATARKAMAPLVAEGNRPSLRMCLIMAELEDAEFGDQGQVREWLARSARAPRDPLWTADGIATPHWAPVSPVTGRLDAFVWQRPAERLGTDLEAPEWTKHWSLPARSAGPADEKPIVDAVVVAAQQQEVQEEQEEQEKEASPASAKGETGAEPVRPALRPVPAAPSSGQNAEARQPLARALASAERPNGPRVAQKVVFPMAGAPDDPGPGDPAPEIRHIGLV